MYYCKEYLVIFSDYCSSVLLAFICIIASVSGSFSPKVIIPLVSHASQHMLLCPPALNNFFERNFSFKGFHEVSRITVQSVLGLHMAQGGIITSGEKDPEATSLQPLSVLWSFAGSVTST